MKKRRSLTYDVVLEPSDGGGSTAYVPSLRGCVSEGETEEEALDNIRDAIVTWHATWEDIAAERQGGFIRSKSRCDQSPRALNQRIVRALTRAGFVLRRQGKHLSMYHADGNVVAVIPRHNPVKRAR